MIWLDSVQNSNLKGVLVVCRMAAVPEMYKNIWRTRGPGCQHRPIMIKSCVLADYQCYKNNKTDTVLIFNFILSRVATLKLVLS